MKENHNPVLFGLLILICVGSASLVNGQKTDEEKAPIRFTTKLLGRACLGEKFDIEGKLSNISDKDVWIEKNMIWRYSTIKALDQNSSNLSLLHLPKMKMSMGDPMYIDGSEDDALIRLKPGESFTDVIEKDPKEDDLYSLPGRFSLTYGYGQFLRRSKAGVKPWVGAIDADELNFEIKSCAEVQPPPVFYNDVQKTVFLYNELARIGKFEELKALIHIIKKASNNVIENGPESLFQLNEYELVQQKLETTQPSLILLSKLKTNETTVLESTEDEARVRVKYTSDIPDQEATPQMFSLLKVDGQWKITNIEAGEEIPSKSPEAAAPDNDCVKVSLTADSNRLEKRNPIQLMVRIENLCGNRIQVSEPSFAIDKSLFNERSRFGDRRVGRIIRNSKIDNTVKKIDPGKNLEFALHTNELRWMDAMSSIDVFGDLFTDHDLKTGSYLLYCTVVVCPSCKLDHKWILSNKIEVLFEEGVKQN